METALAKANCGISDSLPPDVSTTLMRPKWICCQLGAREHYVFPRALNLAGALQMLITDAWVDQRSLWRMMPGKTALRLTERFHPDLAAAQISHFTLPLLGREMLWRLRQRQGWEQVL